MLKALCFGVAAACGFELGGLSLVTKIEIRRRGLRVDPTINDYVRSLISCSCVQVQSPSHLVYATHFGDTFGVLPLPSQAFVCLRCL